MENKMEFEIFNSSNKYMFKENNFSTVPKHRLVIENNNNIKLEHYNHIHHLDFNKSNNDDNNLLLMTSSSHARLHYLIEKCFKFIKLDFPESRDYNSSYGIISNNFPIDYLNLDNENTEKLKKWLNQYKIICIYPKVYSLEYKEKVYESFNLKFDYKKKQSSLIDLSDEEFIKLLQENTVEKIEKDYNTTSRSIRKMINSRNLQQIKIKSDKFKLITDNELLELKKKYQDSKLTKEILEELMKHYSYLTISKIFSCNDSTIRNYAMKFGLISNVRNKERIVRKDISELPSKEELSESIIKIGLLMTALKYNVTSKAIRKWAYRLNIDYNSLMNERKNRNKILYDMNVPKSGRAPTEEELIQLMTANIDKTDIVAHFKLSRKKLDNIINSYFGVNNIPFSMKLIKKLSDRDYDISYIADKMKMSEQEILLSIRHNNLNNKNIIIKPPKNFIIKSLKRGITLNTISKQLGIDINEISNWIYIK